MDTHGNTDAMTGCRSCFGSHWSSGHPHCKQHRETDEENNYKQLIEIHYKVSSFKTANTDFIYLCLKDILKGKYNTWQHNRKAQTTICCYFLISFLCNSFSCQGIVHFHSVKPTRVVSWLYDLTTTRILFTMTLVIAASCNYLQWLGCIYFTGKSQIKYGFTALKKGLHTEPTWGLPVRRRFGFRHLV